MSDGKPSRTELSRVGSLPVPSRPRKGASTALLLAAGLSWAFGTPGCGERFTSCTSSGTCEAEPVGGGGAGGAPESEGGGAAGGGVSGGTRGAAGEGGEAGLGSEGGVGGMGGGGPGVCDPDGSPSAESCLVADEYAIFVAPSGNDQNAGTRAAPVGTFKRALALAENASGAARSAKRIIACAAKFDEALTVLSGLKLYGGFVCPGNANAWEYDPASKTELMPSTAGAVLEVKGVADPVVIEDVSFTAIDGTSEVPSSVAAFVTDSEAVTLRRVTLVAGKGVDGEKGVNAGFTFPKVADLRGADGSSLGGTNAAQCRCPDGSTSRGGGGGSPDANGGPGLPTYNELDGKGGDTSASCGSGGSGRDGVSAPDPGEAGEGAASSGKVTSSGWEPTAGADATNGAPGQGGGGGAGKPDGGGGGGGCGSCGGKGGSGGKGGGASVALLSSNSEVTLTACELKTGDAGNGGAGAAGQAGQQPAGGGGNGFGNSSDKGCPGGGGGLGSAGGNGGGAAGGVSAGIVYVGTRPEPDADTTVKLGKAGKAGIGGNAGENDGVEGLAVDVLEAESAD